MSATACTFGSFSGDHLGPSGGHIPGSHVDLSEDDLLAADWTSDPYASGTVPGLPAAAPVIAGDWTADPSYALLLSGTTTTDPLGLA